MKVLVACEMSGRVREAFRKLGHDAYSCDFMASEIPGQHLRGDVMDLCYDEKLGWDMMIAFPPCTYLAVSGARWFKDRKHLQSDALVFVQILMSSPIKHIAIENPIGVISSKIRKPDQIIQPWMFGHGETKATCLWLKNLPKLKPTNIVSGREAKVHRMAPGPYRSIDRSRTYLGIAEAMANQWGNLELPITIEREGPHD